MVKKKETAAAVGAETLFGMFARIAIQVQLKKRDLGYRELTELLNEKFDLQENERNLRNKIARSTFSAAFFLMCMKALGSKTLDLSSDDMRLAVDFEMGDVKSKP